MKVQKYESILEESTYEKVMKFIADLKHRDKLSNNFVSSFMYWDEYLTESSTPVSMYILSKDEEDLFYLLKTEIEKKIPYFVTKIMIYMWPKLSNINWHNDGMYKGALTIYLNEKWDRNWGGYLMYEEDEKIYAIKPEKNLGVLQSGGVVHSVTTTNINADIRMTIQMFLTKEKNLL